MYPPIITDLEYIERKAEEKMKENYTFRVFLKGRDPDKTDRLVKEINDEVTSQIDCTKCANCCKELEAGVTNDEIRKLAELKNLVTEDFIKQYIREDDFEREPFLKHHPCTFLENNLCSIYDQRPKACRDFPNTHKPGFTSRTLGMINYYGICPIVFNVMERLKLRMRFRFRY
ncbi:MAG: YkgJ family cysteine cluster protein [Bacteroidia bacterium]